MIQKASGNGKETIAGGFEMKYVRHTLFYAVRLVFVETVAFSLADPFLFFQLDMLTEILERNLSFEIVHHFRISDF